MATENTNTHDTIAPIDRNEARILIWELHRTADLLAAMVRTTLSQVDVTSSDNELTSVMAAYIQETADRMEAKSYDLVNRLLDLAGIKQGYPHDIRFPRLDANIGDIKGRLTDYCGVKVARHE